MLKNQGCFIHIILNSILKLLLKAILDQIPNIAFHFKNSTTLLKKRSVNKESYKILMQVHIQTTFAMILIEDEHISVYLLILLSVFKSSVNRNTANSHKKHRTRKGCSI